MAKSIKDILSELTDSREKKRDGLKQQEEEYYEKKELLRQNYLKLMFDKDLNRPLNPSREIYKGSNQGRKKENKPGLVGVFVPVELITPIGNINGFNNKFILPHFPVPGSEHIYLNGLLQDEEDYIIGGDILEFILPPGIGEILQVSYLISL